MGGQTSGSAASDGGSLASQRGHELTETCHSPQKVFLHNLTSVCLAHTPDRTIMFVIFETLPRLHSAVMKGRRQRYRVDGARLWWLQWVLQSVFVMVDGCSGSYTVCLCKKVVGPSEWCREVEVVGASSVCASTVDQRQYLGPRTDHGASTYDQVAST
jgi:hypothetical protein